MEALTQSAKNAVLKVSDYLPTNSLMWIAVLSCVIILVAFSRLLTMQSSIQELQTRPPVDETVIRSVVRQQLEETVRAIDQQNKAQMLVHSQRAYEAAKAAVSREMAERKEERREVTIEEIKEVKPVVAEAKADPKPEAKPEVPEVADAKPKVPEEVREPEVKELEVKEPEVKEPEVKEPEKIEFELNETLDEEVKPRKRKTKN